MKKEQLDSKINVNNNDVSTVLTEPELSSVTVTDLNGSPYEQLSFLAADNKFGADQDPKPDPETDTETDTEMDTEMETQTQTPTSLEDIERELRECVRADNANWTRIYRLMERVNTSGLYSPHFHSFSAWVNGMAVSIGCHVSLLWARLKAGRSYAEYQERAAAAGRSVPDIESLRNVSPDSISLAQKVGGRDTAVVDYLMERGITGDLTRADLRAAAAARSAAGGYVSKSRFDRFDRDAGSDPDTSGNLGDPGDPTVATEGKKTDSAPDPDPETKSESAAQTAAEIVLALRKSKNWIGSFSYDHDNNHPPKYRLLTEFPVDTGTSRYVRRIDALVIENETVNAHDSRNISLCVHGVEIKVSVHDLLDDHKMAEYVNFIDYFYIAVPDRNDMIEAAESIRLSEWGLLAVKNGDVRVVHPAAFKRGIMRDKSLETAVLKLL